MPNTEKWTSWPGWETVRVVGHGSFGTVYEIQRVIGETTEKSALKVITIPKESSEINALSLKGYDKESITERFQGLKESIENEYAMMAKLKGCANVVYCDDIRAIQHDDGMGWDIFIRMELLTPLLEYRNGGMDEREIIRLGKEICNALVMCQKNKIVHRDIKPQNIFVSKDGTFKLGDFGIAKAVEHTTSGTMTGTYDYMAPEVEMHRPYNRTVDIYSLGMVLYWYLNEKRLPFLPLPPAKILWKDETSAKDRRLRGDTLPAPAHGNEELKRIVLKACAFDPKDRYQSAQEMLTDLAKLGGASMDIPFMPVDSDAEKNEGSAQDRFGDSNTEKETEGTVGSFGKENWTKTDYDPTEYGKTIGVFDNLPQPTPKPAPKPKKWPAVLGAVAALILIAAGLYFLPGWEPATCGSPETHKLLKITRGAALEHAYGDWYVIKEATCTATGVKERVCANDPTHVEQREIPLAEHTWLDETCDEPSICAVCGVEGKEATGHDWTTEKRHIMTDDGILRESTFIICAQCGEEITLERISSSQETYTSGDYTYYKSGKGAVIAEYTGNSNNLLIPEQLDNLSVVGIGCNAFSFCDSLETIEIPSSVVGIGDNAFSLCDSLTRIKIPPSVTSIGKRAFNGCSLTTIEIPSSVTSIGENPFCFCSSLTSITVEKDNPAYMVSDGVLYTKSGDCLITYPQAKPDTYFTIPPSVTTIGDNAFNGCGNLMTIEIPSSVAIIGDAAFSLCSNLSTIDIPSSVTRLSNEVFRLCKNLKTIEIPLSVTSIGDNAFSCCYSLTTIEIPSSVTSIGRSVFYGCSSLTTIKIPSSVTSIGDNTFSGCGSLTTIEIPSSVTSIGDYAFSDCDSLTAIEIPSSVTSIGNSVLYCCRSLTDVYYTGTRAQWNAIKIDSQNEDLINARIHYNSK